MKCTFKFKTTLIVGTLSILPFINTASFAWEQQLSDSVDSEPAVTVWTQDVPSSKFKAFKGEVLINAPMDKIVSVIRDTQNVPKWYYKSIHAEQLQRLNDHQSLNYSVTSLPWPVSDRDSVILATVSNLQNGDIIIKMTAKPEAYPVQENLIRVPKLDGLWKLEQQTNNQVKVTLQMATEPGGEIPSWLANAMVIDMPLKSLSNLKKRVENLPEQ